MKSPMKYDYAAQPKVHIPRSSFDRSHTHKTTFNASKWIPIFSDLAYPGDTHKLKMDAFLRMATPLYPVMDNLKGYVHFFGIPIRLVWNNFKKMMGEQVDPDDTTDYLIPQILAPDGENENPSGFQEQSWYDYMGLPTKIPEISISALWARAWNLTFNEWLRDQNLQDSLPVPLDDGPDLYTLYDLLPMAKIHDYFTSLLPFPQKGPAVRIPLSGNAPVYGVEIGTEQKPANLFQGMDASNQKYTFPLGSDFDTGAVMSYAQDPTPGSEVVVNPIALGSETDYDTYDPESGRFVPPYADLEQALAPTLNSLREAITIQQLFERDARGGTRYTEVIRAHFGVISPDARQQRPEYLGGGTFNVNFHPVPQTSETTDTGTPQGTLAAFATGSINRYVGFTKSFTEHTLLIGMLGVRADLTYQQGLDRIWTDRTRLDLFWPTFAHLGEQAVLTQEIDCRAPDYMRPGEDFVSNTSVLGYQERYAHLRNKMSIITGLFRSNATLSLDAWHLSQEFAVPPELSPEFIEEDVPMDRVIEVTDEPDFIADMYFTYHSIRPMPTRSVPGLMRL